MIQEVFEIARKAPFRNKYQVLAKLMEEVGELAEEINISQGFIQKPEGKDGVIGEAIDVIQCALDIIWLHTPSITEEEVLELLSKKNTKWESKFMQEISSEIERNELKKDTEWLESQLENSEVKIHTDRLTFYSSIK